MNKLEFFLSNHPKSHHECDYTRFADFAIESIKNGNEILDKQQIDAITNEVGNEICDYYVNAYMWIRLTLESIK